MRRALLLCLPLALAATLPAASWAVPITMEFRQLHFGVQHIENGITATGDREWGPIGDFEEDNFAFIERSPVISGATRFLDFTIGGARFVPISFDLLAAGSNYCATGVNPGLCEDNDPILYIWASGFIGDTLVSSLGLDRPAALSPLEWETIDLSSLGSVDRLRLEAKTFLDLGLPGTCNGGQGCGKFSADNIVLDTIQVPEPGTLLLLSSALAGLALAHRKRAK